jgi:hypothetical protein
MTISLTVGLIMQYAHGQGFDISELQTITGYCFLNYYFDIITRRYRKNIVSQKKGGLFGTNSKWNSNLYLILFSLKHLPGLTALGSVWDAASH